MSVTAWAGGFGAIPALPAPAAPLVVVPNGATWTASSGVSVANAGTYSRAHPSGRTTGAIFTKNPITGTFGGARAVPVPANFRLSDYQLIGLDVLPNLISGSVSIRFSSDNFATKRVEYSWPFPSQLYNGWNRLSARPNAGTAGIDPNGAWVVTGGQTMDEVINGIQISIATTANNAANIGVDQVMAFAATPVRGAVMFGFDRYEDTSITTLALPLAQKYGIKNYAAGDTDKIIGMGASYQRVKALHDAGWPILSQGPDHKDYVTAGAAQLAVDVEVSRNTLRSVGLTNALDYFAYPFSSNNAATDAVLLNAGFRIASTGIGWNGHPNEYNLGYKLIGQGRINIGGMTLTQVKALIDRAALYGVVVDLFCHGLTPGGDGGTPPADTLLWYANDWEAAIIYAMGYRAAGRIDVTDPVSLFNARGSLPVLA